MSQPVTVEQCQDEIRALLPLSIEDLPDLKARYPGLIFRLTWPTASPGLALEVGERPNAKTEGES